MTNRPFPLLFFAFELIIMKLTFTVVCMLLISVHANAQPIDKNELAQKVGIYMKRLGPMQGSTITNIIDSIRNAQFNEVETTYAIYYWLTHYVDFDSKAFHHRHQANFSASAALTERKATSEGYAALFKAMCDIARIECVVIDGFAKAQPEFVGRIKDRNKHSWNAVKIRNTWYYVDATWGAGTVNRKFREYEKNYSDAWFFTKRQLFQLSHYTASRKWQLADEPVNRSVFTNAPTIHKGAVVLQVFPEEQLKGRLRGKEKDCKRIVLDMELPDKINSAEVLIAGKKIPVDFYKQGHTLSVDLPFPKKGKYPVLLYLNGTPSYGFMAEVSKKKRA